MQEFAEEYVANLQPRDERYDTRLGDDFYVSTFPNGVKTWIFLYEVNGYTRRQTLGVYPEMPLEKALESLYAARRTRSVEKELMDQGLDGSSQVRQAEDSPIDLTAKATARAAVLRFRPGKGFVPGVVAGAVLAGGIVWFLPPGVNPGTASVASAVARVATPPVPAARVEPSVPAARVEPSVPAVVEHSVRGPEIAASDPAEGNLPTGQHTAATPLSAAAPGPSALPGADSAAAGGDTVPSEIASRTSPQLSESQREVIELQRDMIGTLAWSQLTSGIVQGEPIDDLGWQIQLSNQPRRVFFFVRVRGMSGSTVYYRWTYEGTVIKRDTVRVGEGWHSPAFSSVTLTPEREGIWQVEVMDSEGNPLGAEQFQTSRDRIAAVIRR